VLRETTGRGLCVLVCPSRTSEGGAYANLGNSIHSNRDFSKALEYHMQHLAIAKEVGDRAGEGRAYTDLGMQVAGDLSKAIEYHAQHPATAKEVGDRAGKGAAYGNLGKAYPSLGDYSSFWQRTIPLSGNARNAGVRAGGVGAHPILRGSRASALALRTQCGTHCSTQCVPRSVEHRGG